MNYWNNSHLSITLIKKLQAFEKLSKFLKCSFGQKIHSLSNILHFFTFDWQQAKVYPPTLRLCILPSSTENFSRSSCGIHFRFFSCNIILLCFYCSKCAERWRHGSYEAIPRKVCFIPFLAVNGFIQQIKSQMPWGAEENDEITTPKITNIHK